MRDTCVCRDLVLLGTTIALEISQNMNADELAKMSGLFFVIADELALLSLCAPDENVQEEEIAALY